MRERRHAGLSLLEKELDRIGLVLQHDAELPSATALLAGAPIAGSWWGHPLGKELYAWLGEFEQGAGALSLKLINGKVTYVAARLWPAVLAVAETGAQARATALTSTARALLKHMHAVGRARGDDFAAVGCASSKAFALAAKEVESACLAHVDSVHTASGAHTKVLTPWPRWAEAHGVAPVMSVALAQEALLSAVASLGKSAKRPLKLPAWMGLSN